MGQLYGASLAISISREDRGRYAAKDFKAPPIGPEDPPQIPLVFRDLSEDDKRGIISAYYTSVQFLDENIGRVLAALTKLGLDKNTVVMYTADHGYMLGQHGRFEKHCGYDPALRVPLAIRYTGRYKPRVVRDMTEHVDLSATILDLLGAKPFEYSTGQSLTPYLDRGSHPTPRDWIFAEYLENEEAYIRTRDYKFVYCTGKRARQEGLHNRQSDPGPYMRLYDLRSDPGEFHDISAKSAELVAKFTTQMATRFRNTDPRAAQLPHSASDSERSITVSVPLTPDAILTGFDTDLRIAKQWSNRYDQFRDHALRDRAIGNKRH